MADRAEVAIESALLDHVVAFASSPAIPISLPNVDFTQPVPGPTTYWLRATYLPADTAPLGVDFGAYNEHMGIFQVDVFYGRKAGELKAARLAASIMDHFARGTRLAKDGVTVEINRRPSRARALYEDEWMQVPVTIPWIAFAKNPA